jgi:hypothetical protein
MKIDRYGSVMILEHNVTQVVEGVEVTLPKAWRELVPCVKIDGVWQDTDISSETQEVQDFCTAQWSDAIKQEYKDHTDACLVVE